MKRSFHTKLAAFTCAALAAGQASAATVTYQAVDITPPDESLVIGGAVGGGWVVGKTTTSDGTTHAAAWNPAAGRFVDLHPGHLRHSAVNGAGGGQLAGTQYSFVPNDVRHAGYWDGPEGQWVDLHPAGARSSVAIDTDGVHQGGWATIDGRQRPILWRGSATDYVDLTPPGAQYGGAVVNAVDGDRQAGNAYISIPFGATSHAMVWSGTAESAIDLSPGGRWYNTQIVDMAGDLQVGRGLDGDGTHAVMWRGTPESFVALTPAGHFGSAAFATDGVHQVGHSSVPGAGQHAYLWSGSAESGIDLHAFLPDHFESSAALAIEDGIIYGQATDGRGKGHLIAWNAIPEPSALSLLALAAGGLLARRRRPY